MKDTIVINVLPKDGNRVLAELSKGNMVVARSENNFVYFLENGDKYRLFSHVPGMPNAGRKTIPKTGRHDAVIRSFAEMADGLFLVEYDREMNLSGVLASAEEGMLMLCPGRERDADKMIEFFVPEIKPGDRAGCEDA